MSRIAAAIIAGGKSLRFGNDKALLKFDNIFLIEQIFNTLTLFTKEIDVIGEYRESANIAKSFYKKDLINNIGPIGGLYTALSFVDKPLIIVPCDMPFLTSHDIKFLIDKFNPRYEATIAVSSKGLEPLLGIYKPTVLPQIRQAINQKEFALYHLIEKMTVNYVHYEKNDYNSRVFFNINTLSDYKKALYLKEQNFYK